jgi:hypothetical protein
MKLIVAIILVLTISESQQQLENLTILEYNFLFQFGDLDTDQFNYLDYLWLGYIHRMKNQQKTMNEFITGENNQGGEVIDVACIVEWNGNVKSRYYIPTQEEFAEVMEINELFDKMGGQIKVISEGEVQTIIPENNIGELDNKFFPIQTQTAKQKELMERIIKIREKYKYNFFPYFQYEKFTEFIPTEKRLEKKERATTSAMLTPRDGLFSQNL